MDAAPSVERDAVLQGELIEDGYLSGGVMRNEDGCICGSSSSGITTKGRLFLQSLQTEEDSKSVAGSAKRIGVFTLGVVVGVVSAVIVEIAKAILHLTIGQ